MNKNISYNLAIVGRYPPPVGGVTVHNKRLFEHALRYGISTIFFNFDGSSLERH